MNALERVLSIVEDGATRPFLIDCISDTTITFEDLHRSAIDIASFLHGCGLQRGDRIALLLHNSGEFAKLYFGCLYAGIVTVPLNPNLTPREIRYIVSNCKAKMLAVSKETVHLIEGPEPLQPELTVINLLDRRPRSGTISGMKELDLQSLAPAPTFMPFESVTPNDLMTVVYTSGTTASPQGVAHRIFSMLENAVAFNSRLGINSENRFYNMLSMPYLGGYYNLLMLPFMAGASVVLTDAFNAKMALNFWRAAIDHDVNTLWLVPTIASILLEMDRGDEGTAYCRERIRLALIGTAPLPQPLREAFERRYGVRLYENYGLSETFFITTQAPALPHVDRSVGKVLPQVQVTITDAEGVGVEYGTEGEIKACTPYLMEGYYDAAEGRIAKRDPRQWFSTGDLGMLLPSGELFITGRKKDLIIRGGVNVSAAAVEEVILGHPAVIECAVVGIPHGVYGEDIACVVRLAEGRDLSEINSELRNLCNQQLNVLNRPAHFFEMHELPKSTTGKIKKQAIRALLVDKLNLQVLESPRQSSVGPSAPATSLPGRVRRDFKRPDTAVVKALSEYSASLISDCMNRMGIMSAAIQRIVPGGPFAGPAVTVEEAEGGNLMSHLALELVREGDVIVIDAKAVMTRAAWGGLQTLAAKQRGAKAVVVDGTIRDANESAKLGLPIFARGTSPGGPLKGASGNVNYPIACGGVVVNPGDIVVGDGDGVVVVPQELAEALIELCKNRLSLEQRWLASVEAGHSTVDAVGLREQAERLKIRYEPN